MNTARSTITNTVDFLCNETTNSNKLKITRGKYDSKSKFSIMDIWSQWVKRYGKEIKINKYIYISIQLLKVLP